MVWPGLRTSTYLRGPQYDLPISEYVSHRMEIREMNLNRKWFAFPVSAGALLVLGIVAGPGLYGADDESPLGKIMEKVNKHNSTITKGTRNKVNFVKSRKDVEKSAKELVKLGKEAKVITDAVKKAKIAEPQKKWDEYMDDLIKSSEVLGDVTAKTSATYDEAKSAFNVVKKACADCHKDFRVEEGSF
jgi:cytochrome c556